MPRADPVADLITRLHLLRLVLGKDTPPNTSYLIGYAQESYPERLDNLVISYHIWPIRVID